jgi:hypothetical protein
MNPKTASRGRGKQASRQVSREDAAGKPTRSAGQNFLLAGASRLACRQAMLPTACLPEACLPTESACSVGLLADGLPAKGLLAVCGLLISSC